MLNTLVEFSIKNGIILETYSVEQDDDGEIFVRNVLDSDTGGPVDLLHIDAAAAVPIARALLLAVGRIAAPVYVDIPAGNVVAFPMGRA